MRHRPACDLSPSRSFSSGSRPLARCQTAPSSHSRLAAAALNVARRHACTHAPAVRVMAMQSGWQPQPQQPQQLQQQPMQPMQQQQQQQQPARQLAPMARGSPYPATPVFLELTQVSSNVCMCTTMWIAASLIPRCTACLVCQGDPSLCIEPFPWKAYAVQFKQFIT
jgi:hypothetical protein